MSVRRIDWGLTLIQGYDCSRSRYTLYPTVLEFSEDFDEQAFLRAVVRCLERPLSPYIHVPFCHKFYYFCSCNKIIARQQRKADQCLDVLEQEIVHRAPLFAGCHVNQLHRGGGTPACLNRVQTNRLMRLLRESFQSNADMKILIEVDSWEVELDILDHLRIEGLNRLSMGMQDLSKEVRHLVNREQDEEFIFTLLSRAYEIGFASTNVNLIYGLSKWTSKSFASTLKHAMELNPDCLDVFSYAHLSTIFAAQHKIRGANLPSPQQRLDILQETIVFLAQSNYQFVSVDHLVRPDGELAVAQCRGVLYRNFRGYITQGDAGLLGVGVSVTNMIGDYYTRNQKELRRYYQ